MGDDFAQFGFDDTTANPNASAMRRDGEFQVRSGTGGGTDSGVDAMADEIFMLVLKAEKTGVGNYNLLSLFVNPDSLTEGTPDATTGDTGLSMFDFFVARTAFHESGDTFQIDQILIGEAWEDVVTAAPTVPEPASIAIWSLIGLAFTGYFRIRRKK